MREYARISHEHTARAGRIRCYFKVNMELQCHSGTLAAGFLSVCPSPSSHLQPYLQRGGRVLYTSGLCCTQSTAKVIYLGMAIPRGQERRPHSQVGRMRGGCDKVSKLAPCSSSSKVHALEGRSFAGWSGGVEFLHDSITIFVVTSSSRA
jgi:hypothetical protein